VSYKVLSNLLSLIHRSLLQKYVKQILKILLQELCKFSTSFCKEVIECFDSLFKKFKTSIKREGCNINQLIDSILLNGLHEKSIEFLKSFKIFFKEENLQTEISIKILLVISLTLNRRIFNF